MSTSRVLREPGRPAGHRRRAHHGSRPGLLRVHGGHPQRPGRRSSPTPARPAWTLRCRPPRSGRSATSSYTRAWCTAGPPRTSSASEADPEPFHAEGLAAPDPVIWLHDGGLDLIRALQSAPPDLEAMVFLKNAPAPRQFWARRQCHETTIHSVDAQAAALGRFPRAADTEITRQIALDGIDELLNGFLTRGKSSLRSEKPAAPRHPAERRRPLVAGARQRLSRPSSSRTATSAPTWCSRPPRSRSTSRCGTGPTRSRARPTTSGAAPPR